MPLLEQFVDLDLEGDAVFSFVAVIAMEVAPESWVPE